MLGTQDLLIGLVLAAFFFGAKRLPELARSLGQSMTEFKKAVAGDDGGRNVPESAAPEAAWNHCARCGAAAPPSVPHESAR